MEFKKRHVVSTIVALRISSYVMDRKEDLIKLYDLLCSGEYIALIDSSIKFTRETLEYIVTLS